MNKVKNILLLVGAILVIALGTILLLRRSKPSGALGREFEAYKAANTAQKRAAELGHTLAVKEIEEEHKEVIVLLEKTNKEVLTEARKSPQKLAKLIARSGD